MNIEHIHKLLQHGENVVVEFKECTNALNRDVYETVCAFLNRHGGELLLGVNDKGKITGIDPSKIEQIQKDFVTAINNTTKLNPTYYLTPQEFIIDGKHILYINVPESSQVHRCNNRIFDRNNDADIDVTDNTNLVGQLYFRKHKQYTENLVYPHVKMEDLRSDIIEKARHLAIINRKDHPWKSMSDIELIKSAGLYQLDSSSNQHGFTLAAILLLGHDDTIRSTLPHMKTDAILRVVNLDRYDDRDIIVTNLIDSFTRLTAFVDKHLPDPFYVDETQHRISLRDKIFREVISNTLIHREYLNRFPAKLIIERNRVVIENGNIARTHGSMTPANYAPFPKNPVIAQFFREIGLAEELGSGIRNLFRYTKEYSGSDPELTENDVFRAIVPLDERLRYGAITDQATEQATDQAIMQVKYESMVLEFCSLPRSREEIQNFLELKHRRHFNNTILKPLIKQGKLLLTIPDKPTSPKQKYYSKKM